MSSPAVLSLPLPGYENATVNTLMIADCRTWNTDIISSLFNDDEKNLILKVPIPWFATTDSIFWSHEPSGEFSVKSCYYSIVNQSQLSSLPSNFIHPVWKKLWELKIPSRISIFLWKLGTNSLPTLARLRQRHVQVEPLCSLCGEAVESTFHVLITCSFAYQVWADVFGEG